jgi:hypothetical protein
MPQLMHKEEIAAPIVAEYFPAIHTEHAVIPATAAKLPAAQLVHVADATATEYKPKAQVLHAVAPDAAAIVPATQLTHAELPAANAKLPIAQIVQVADSSEEYWPAAQSRHEVEPTLAKVPATQPVHEDDEDALLNAENVPAMQFLQLVEPVLV